MALKNEIVSVSITKFSQFGIKKVSVDEIAKELNISKKTIYTIFKSKDDIVASIVSEICAELKVIFTECSRNQEMSLEILAELFTQVEYKISSKFGIYFIRDVFKYYKPLWNKIHRVRKENLNKLEIMIQKNQQIGNIHKNINSFIAVKMLICIIDNFGNPEFLLKNNLTPKELISTIKTIFLKGMYT